MKTLHSVSEINQRRRTREVFTYKKYLGCTNSSRQKVDGDGQEQGGKLLFIRSRAFVRDYVRCFSCCCDKIPT